MPALRFVTRAARALLISVVVLAAALGMAELGLRGLYAYAFWSTERSPLIYERVYWGVPPWVVHLGDVRGPRARSVDEAERDAHLRQSVRPDRRPARRRHALQWAVPEPPRLGARATGVAPDHQLVRPARRRAAAGEGRRHLSHRRARRLVDGGHQRREGGQLSVAAGRAAGRGGRAASGRGAQLRR